MTYNKHFIPLESNPILFNNLIHQLGVSEALCFYDVLSVSEPELVASIPRPVLALIIIHPTAKDYDNRLAHLNKLEPEHHQSGDSGDTMWFKQTINNACGFYGILHAVANGKASDFIQPTSHLSRLLQQCASLNPSHRASVLENDQALESIYTSVAVLGDTEAPHNAEDQVDFHYVCFVKSRRSGHLFIMDGDRNGPVNMGPMADDDLLSEMGLKAIQDFIQQNDEGGHFSLLALAPS